MCGQAGRNHWCQEGNFHVEHSHKTCGTAENTFLQVHTHLSTKATAVKKKNESPYLPEWWLSTLSNGLTRPGVAGRGSPHHMPPGELLATVLQPPVLGPHTNIPVGKVQGDGSVPLRGEGGEGDALTQFTASLVGYASGDVHRGNEIRGQSFQSNLHDVNVK